ncbi:MAG: PQQ-binding-like beta-propeller repeat protein [Candidatus Saliniplasma sp.]
MKKQAVILISTLLLLSVVVVPAVNVSQTSAEPEEDSPFGQEPLWNVNLSEDQILVAAVEGDQVLAMNETTLHFLEGDGEIRWSREFNETLYNRRVERPRNIDGYILTYLRNEETTEFKMHLIDLEDGTTIWEKPLDSDPYSVGYIVGEDNSVFILSEDQIIKISEEGEELWQTETDLGFAFSYNTRIGPDGNLIGVTEGWGIEDNKIICFSPEGELKWEREIEEQESFRRIDSDFVKEDIYLLNDKTMYKLNAEEEIIWSRNFTNLENIRNFKVIDERIFVLASSDDQNLTLSEISEDGEERWNTTVEIDDMSQSFHPLMEIVDNKRIIFGNYNLSSEMLKVEDTYAFDLDGTLMWEHQFEKNVTYFPQISDSGTIYISTTEGDIYAFQDQTLESERDPHLLLDYWWILAVVIATVILISIVGLKVKGDQEVQDTYEEEERPTVGEERYQHRPYEWDDGSGYESNTFERIHEDGQLEPERTDDDR